MSDYDVERAVQVMAMLERRLTGDLAETVAWFEEQMPTYYKSATPLERQVEHVQHVHALRTSGAATSTVRAPDDSEVVVYAPQSPELLLNAIGQLRSHQYHRVSVDGSVDGSLAIASFSYQPDAAPEHFDPTLFRRQVIKATCTKASCIPRHVAERYLDEVGVDYLARSNPERLARHIRAWTALEDPESVYVTADTVRDATGISATRIMVAANMSRADFVDGIARTIAKSGVHLHRFYCDRVPALVGDEYVLIASIYLTTPSRRPIGVRRAQAVCDDLLVLHRRFRGRYGDLVDQVPLSQAELEVLLAGIDFLSQTLPLDASFLDVRDVGMDLIQTQPTVCAEIAQVVFDRFGPNHRTERGLERRVSSLRKRIEQHTPVAQERVLEGLLDFVDGILLTNIARTQRLGQAFLLSPSLLPADHFPQQPYAILYVHCRDGMGYQVRFRASARGGLRLLLPRNDEQLGRVRDNLLREVYALAWAQQLKNKDIPEGGSKCIGLAAPSSDPDALLHALTDGFLDLVLPPEQVPEIIGPHGAKRTGDLLFLGPDENMTPERIVWVAERAALRGLPNPGTFMSSKPGAGINHKEYGVTSEGVHAWLPSVLQMIGRDPADGFSVTMTGGPDGDVAGNLLKILHREHGKRCRVLGLADGSGAAYDPAGLDWRELLRLVKRSSPIIGFNPKKLSGGDAWVASAEDRSGAERRNRLHTSVAADLLLPCGGRPYTINDYNWQQMLDADGAPIVRGMIEGANIFITQSARAHLEDAGVVVVKDSSANKGGVITSSYEILAGLVISEDEFADIKDRYVTDVVDRLRVLGDMEAKALITAWHRRRGREHLADLSQQMSEEIVRVSGLFEAHVSRHLADGSYAAYWDRELKRHCPPVLVERFGRRLADRIPHDHIVAILAKRLASRMVYHEGLTWCRTYIPDDDPSYVLQAYIEAGETAGTVMDRLARRPGIDTELANAVRIGTRRELVRRQLGR